MLRQPVITLVEALDAETDRFIGRVVFNVLRPLSDIGLGTGVGVSVVRQPVMLKLTRSPEPTGSSGPTSARRDQELFNFDGDNPWCFRRLAKENGMSRDASG